MDLIDYVTKLQSLLIQHDRAVQQILRINDYIADIGRQAFTAAMYGTSQQVMQLLQRKTVAEGVKKMYKHYRLKKWLRVQIMVKNKSTITNPTLNNLSDLSQWNSLFHEYPDLNILQGADPMVQGWAIMHCEFSRYS